ncbi:hypothetical protein CHS0354_004845 [Potamilus streckersoni]|uniref:Uncharacterized protein n=1 Tax=Potamilus streckersoni TaxID=2493646 RepID=A0AAE0S8Y6_9BIVA|nr:hypothetical protein CHS0354_004845 [Potamilus streckersoni]
MTRPSTWPTNPPFLQLINKSGHKWAYNFFVYGQLWATLQMCLYGHHTANSFNTSTSCSSVGLDNGSTFYYSILCAGFFLSTITAEMVKACTTGKKFTLH